MRTLIELEKRQYDRADLFRSHMSNKRYKEAKLCYDTARTIAVEMDLGEEKMVKLFGSRESDPPIEGLFPERLVQKAYEACIFQEQKTKEEECRRREAQRARKQEKLQRSYGKK